MAAPADQRIAVPIDDPNADTEWNEILRKHGIIPEKPPSPGPMIQEALDGARRIAFENRLESRDLDELAELEDTEDEAFLEQYRQKRMRELSALRKKAIHGSVYPVAKPDYAREVTEASHKGPVLVNLTSAAATNIESAVLTDLWRQAAQEYGEVKFCQMPAAQAIENYPERNCPTILAYKNGEIAKQIVTLATIGGVRMSMLNVDDLLVEMGAVPDTDLRVLKRLREAEDDEEERIASRKNSLRVDLDLDDEWD